MTVGIYKLNFIGTNKVYIGQSVDINKRYVRHIATLKAGTSSIKLQSAYETYGTPTLEVLVECTVKELDQFEIEAIDIYQSFSNGFNSTPGGSIPNQGSSRYSKEELYSVLYLLGVPGVSLKSVSEYTGVSFRVINHIANLESHIWMKDEYPSEYAKIVQIHSTKEGRRGAHMLGIEYPTIYSPEGIPYSVKHVNNFAIEHGLLQPKLYEVLKGTRGHHLGWHLEGYTKEPNYPTIVSPDGVEFSIEYGKLKNFAKEHGLTHPLLHKMIRGNSLSHKGWKLASKI